MIKVLIIEDNPYKRDKIKLLLQDKFEIVIEEANSFTSGWQHLNNNEYHLVCLDMSLPTFDQNETNGSGEFRAFGGKELARKMKRRKINSKFVVITQYKNFSDNKSTSTFDIIKNEMRKDYAENCLDVIFYSNKQSEWAVELINLIEEHIVENFSS
jgi:DNA-binding NarL/FixJ family response regulator